MIPSSRTTIVARAVVIALSYYVNEQSGQTKLAHLTVGTAASIFVATRFAALVRHCRYEVEGGKKERKKE